MARTRYTDSTVVPPLRSLPAAALRAVLREGYSSADLRADALAGVVVGIVALPLAMALAIAVGMPPQHGIYTAIIGGFVVAALGGSRMQVSGPTAAFVVVLAPIYAKFGLAGLLLSGLLGGLVLIAMGLLRLGKLIELVPHPVTTGFTAGIATVIASLQIKDLWRASSPWEWLIAGTSLAGLIALPRATKKIPAAIVVLPASAVAALVLAKTVPGFSVATIATRFQTTVGDHVVAGIPQLPPLPILPWLAPGSDRLAFDLETLRALLPSALAIAMLGAIESLLCAVVADGMARTRHDPDAELIASGVGNVVVPFFGGIPCTGAIARTATNVRSGARSPVAAMIHAALILAAVLLLAPLLGYLPMAALAGLLLLVAWKMSEAGHFVHILKVAPRSDVAILLTCFGLTVTFDMVVGVSVGMVLAAFLFMRRMADMTQIRTGPSERPDLPTTLPAGVVLYEISGPLFFGAAQRAMSRLTTIADGTKAVIVLMRDVHTMDATGLVALESALEGLRRHRCLAVLTSVQTQPRTLLDKAHVVRPDGMVVFASSLQEAERLCAGAALS